MKFKSGYYENMDEILSDDLRKRMRNKERFVVLLNENKILSENEFEEWYDENLRLFGNPEFERLNPRRAYEPITDKTGKRGYCIRDFRTAFDLMVPEELI